MNFTKKKDYNIEYKQEINLIYEIFKNEISHIFKDSMSEDIDVSIYQVGVNSFVFDDFSLRLYFNDNENEKNIIMVDYPKIITKNGNLFLNNDTREIYHFFLNKDFNHQNFNALVNEKIVKLNYNYEEIAKKNFINIRENFFLNKNLEFIDYEKKYFSKPKVLIKCNTTINTIRYQYKAGEGSKYKHEFNIEFVDVFNFDNLYIKKYLKFLNDSNPAETIYEDYEMRPKCFPEYSHYALDLSSDINRYIKIFENDNNREIDYSIIGKKLTVSKNINDDKTFIKFLIIYVLLKFDLETIIIFFQLINPSKHHIKNNYYRNLILSTEYFLDNKNENSHYYLNGYNKIFDSTLETLQSETNYGIILSSFNEINGNQKDLDSIIFFYINYFEKRGNDSSINYSEIMNIFYLYFN